MVRKLPYADWKAAQAELERIREQMLQIDLPQLAPMLEQIRKSLVVEASPTLAGAELEFVATQLLRYPELRDSVARLSQKLLDFPFAELSAVHLTSVQTNE